MTSMTMTRKERGKRKKPLAILAPNASDQEIATYCCAAPGCGQPLPVPARETQRLVELGHLGATLCPLDFLLAVHRHWKLLEAEDRDTAQALEEAAHIMTDEGNQPSSVPRHPKKNREWVTAGEQHPRAVSRETIWQIAKDWLAKEGVLPFPTDFDVDNGLPSQATVRKRFKGGWHGMIKSGAEAEYWNEDDMRAAFQAINKAHDRSLLHNEKFWKLISDWVDRNPGCFPRHDQFHNGEGLPSMSSVCRYYQGLTGLLYAGLERGIWSEEQVREAKLRSREAQLRGFPQMRRGGRRLTRAQAKGENYVA
jgi:hypothetical protein